MRAEKVSEGAVIVGSRLQRDLARAVERHEISYKSLKVVTPITDDHLPAASVGQFNKDIMLGFGDIDSYQDARRCGRVRIGHAGSSFV